MATGKRAPKKTTKKRSSGRGKRARKGASPLSRVRDGLAGAVSGEAVGVFLLAVGLFFSAALVSGRGAFLGDAGSFATAQLFGRVGLALAPLAVLAGLLLLLGRLRGRVVAGAALLLLAGAASFAATTLPPRHLFSARHYPDAGGILGSGIYAGVHWIAGAIGATLAIALLYAVGLSLLTG
ncbi:MAG: DNA translocase FtsK 4TM domain-containing protein, partial [Rubrobacter sp.]